MLKALDYGVLEKNILGVRYGLKGFASKTHPPIKLTRDVGGRGSGSGSGEGALLVWCTGDGDGEGDGGPA